LLAQRFGSWSFAFRRAKGTELGSCGLPEGKLVVEPTTFAVGARATATLTVTNTGTTALEDAQPPTNLTFSTPGRVQVATPVTPSSVALLDAGASTTFTWEYEGVAAGSVIALVNSVTATRAGQVLTSPGITGAFLTVQ
jgi:hypothetical protein